MQPFSFFDASSFYHLHNHQITGMACSGLACFSARNDNPPCWQLARQQTPPLYCLGHCFAAPAQAGQAMDPPHISAHARQTVLLGNLLDGGATVFSEYLARGGGQALALARHQSATQLIASITASGLRGRGGGGFPAGRKWQAVTAATGQKKYLVVNADEGDAGAFSDRLLLEGDPFCLIEACLIAAQAIGASDGYLYLRKEYPLAEKILASALTQARQAGWLGEQFDLHLVCGEGSYLCGEETALLNALELKRPQVRARPPLITQCGLFGAPTLVHNVETLCAVPWIIRHGANAYASMGYGNSRGTKLLSLNSLFQRPGLYEVEFGIPLADIVQRLGGGLHRGQLKGLMIGGPLAGIVPPSLLATPLDYEALQTIGCAVGHGGVIAFSDDTTMLDIMAEVFRFGAEESCGKCTPCHFGAPALAQMLSAAQAGHTLDRQGFNALLAALAQSSQCGHGRGLAEFAHAVQRHFPEEMQTCFT